MVAAVVAAGAGGVGVEDTMVAAVQCGGTVDMMNVGSHAPTCPPIYMVLRERGPTTTRTTSAPDQGA
jgi:hypothetical protein